jgi:hypothetical protein
MLAEQKGNIGFFSDIMKEYSDWCRLVKQKLLLRRLH